MIKLSETGREFIDEDEDALLDKIIAALEAELTADGYQPAEPDGKE